MIFIMLESGAVALTILIALEMRRQRMTWGSVFLRSLVVLGAVTCMIVMWRGR